MFQLSWKNYQWEVMEMAEHSFYEVVRQLNRMCESRHGVCNGAVKGKCPLYSIMCNCYLLTLDRAVMIEQIVMDWAKKHPEPIYPTWGEWLNSVTHQMVDGDLLDSPIPANIAPLIGVVPIK